MPDGGRVAIRVFRSGIRWNAECVDYDIGTQAVSVKRAIEILRALVCIEAAETMRRTGSYFGGIPRPPDRPIEGTIQTTVEWKPIDVQWDG